MPGKETTHRAGPMKDVGIATHVNTGGAEWELEHVHTAGGEFWILDNCQGVSGGRQFRRMLSMME